ncbi:hypothetical protein, partial [Methanogenium cariaci]|uniref:hypothetical protein n=1 Tax=Methanogenium cariaci TaxID=2197 RepID=UPI000B329661
MNEIEKTKTETESEPGTEPGTKNGSPIRRPCTTIALSGTASEPFAAEPVSAAVGERKTAIRNALSLLFFDGDVVELRALGDGGVHSGYFNDFDQMAERAAAMNRFTDVHGVYVTLNEVNPPALLSRRANRVKQRLSRSDATTADADIVRRRL